MMDPRDGWVEPGPGRSVRFFAGTSNRRERTIPVFLNQYVDAVAHGMYSIKLRGRGRIAGLDPSDQLLERVIASALAPHEAGGWLDRALPAFLRRTVRHLLLGGKSFYELVTEPPCSAGSESSQSGIPAKYPYFELQQIQRGTVRKRLGKYVQEVPEDLAARFDLDAPIALAPGSVFEIDWPSDGPAFARHRRQVEFLRNLGTTGLPEFALDPSKSRSIGFDVDGFGRTRAIGEARAMRKTGWSLMGTLSQYATTYYYFCREVRLAEFKVTLRDHILQSLNDILRAVGQRFGFEAKIVSYARPSVEDIERAKAVLEEGKPFQQILSHLHPG